MQKLGRNDPCPCGSGQKYKRCCLTSDAEVNAEMRRARARGAGPYESVGPARQMVEFAQPLLDGAGDSPEIMQRAMDLGVIFWNLAILPGSDRRKFLDERLSSMSEHLRDDFRHMASMMIERHRLMFPELHWRS